jgi:hypothetical protein
MSNELLYSWAGYWFYAACRLRHRLQDDIGMFWALLATKSQADLQHIQNP